MREKYYWRGGEDEGSGRWRLSDAPFVGARDKYGHTTSTDGLSNVKTAAQGRRYGVRKAKPSSGGTGEWNARLSMVVKQKETCKEEIQAISWTVLFSERNERVV